MNLVELFNTPEQAAEVEQRMAQLGWTWHRHSGSFKRAISLSTWEGIRPARTRGGGYDWCSYALTLRTGNAGIRFPDPVSCAVAWELLG